MCQHRELSSCHRLSVEHSKAQYLFPLRCATTTGNNGVLVIGNGDTTVTVKSDVIYMLEYVLHLQIYSMNVLFLTVIRVTPRKKVFLGYIGAVRSAQ